MLWGGGGVRKSGSRIWSSGRISLQGGSRAQSLSSFVHDTHNGIVHFRNKRGRAPGPLDQPLGCGGASAACTPPGGAYLPLQIPKQVTNILELSPHWPMLGLPGGHGGGHGYVRSKPAPWSRPHVTTPWIHRLKGQYSLQCHRPVLTAFPVAAGPTPHFLH